VNAHEAVVQILLDAFQPARWSDGATAVYVRELRDLDPEVLEVAARQLIRTTTFMPKVHEVLVAVRAVVAGQQPDPGEGWIEVVESFSAVGRYGRPRWSHPLIGRAVEAIGGWRWLCDSENPVADRAQFIRAYERLAARAEREELLVPALGGLITSALPDLSISRELPEGTDDA
jgi:hypothetical protein